MNTSVYERAPRLSEAADVAAQPVESSRSAVSWAAILAGAVVAASVSVILVALGSGMGFAAASAWPGAGASVTSFAVTTGIWVIVVQWVSAAFGGYLTGRLRTKWVGTHTHEVFFRDTAHGFVTWAVATVMVAVIIASAGSSAIGAGARAVGAVGAGAAQAAASVVSGYDVDTLFRTDRTDAAPSASESRAEATRILINGVSSGDVPAADRTYLAQLVAARTGVSEPDAERRVEDTIAQVKAADVRVRQAAEVARKAAASAAFFTALSLVVGAFIASVSAALGGRLRDEQM